VAERFAERLRSSGWLVALRHRDTAEANREAEAS